MAYKVKVVDNKTIIDKIVVGVPIRTVYGSSSDINVLQGIDASQRRQGSLLVWDDDRQLWVATNDFDFVSVDGGYY